MRILRFIVNGECVERDPSCDFSGLFPGRIPDIRAEFSFSPEWDNKTKVVGFWSMLNAEYEPQLLSDDNTCAIPSEALARPAFKLQVLGRRGKNKLETNKLTILQTGNRRE